MERFEPRNIAMVESRKVSPVEMVGRVLLVK